MDSASQNEIWTYADYAQLPASTPYELIHGELVREPSPAVRHQDIVAELAMCMRHYVQEQSLGVVVPAPTDVRFSDTVTLHPDVLFVSNERRDRITKQYIDNAPDLIVEILSPSTAKRDPWQSAIGRRSVTHTNVTRLRNIDWSTLMRKPSRC